MSRISKLNQAIRDGELKKVKRIIAPKVGGLIGAVDVNKAGKDGVTPLLMAVEEGHIEIVELLLEEGADINGKSQVKGAVVARGITNAMGSDKKKCDMPFVTPLIEAAYEGHKDLANLLVSKGADVNAKSHSGMSPLMNASYEGHYKIVQMLLKNGAEVNAKNNKGLSPLFYAATDCHISIIKLLMTAGADINIKDNDGDTPLMGAILNNHTGAVEQLLVHKPELNEKNNDGVSVLITAAYNGNSKIVDMLVKSGADVDITNDLGLTSLHWAAQNGHVKTVKLLVTVGADINLGTKDDGSTALMGAADFNAPGIIDILCENGAEIDAQDTNGETALIRGVRFSHPAVVENLLERGANKELKDNNGKKPIEWVKEKKHKGIKKMLREGVDKAIDFSADHEPRGPWAGVLFELAEFREADYGRASINMLLKCVGKKNLIGAVIHGGDIPPELRYWCLSIHTMSYRQEWEIRKSIGASEYEKLAPQGSNLLKDEEIRHDVLVRLGYIDKTGDYKGM
ncbi:MAG: hypothetical protein GY757_31965 [bacterium]|nr:hypothetical protein [bacterium]